ncbi:MAG: beta-galactosidase trimerization domain-containing protein [Verrucomicrobiales bacterium]|jgi:hypothetical protein|nr:beta-galactosidase trimerization domain-containing protein [Verrucomicrobiales bacterium]
MLIRKARLLGSLSAVLCAGLVLGGCDELTLTDGKNVMRSDARPAVKLRGYGTLGVTLQEVRTDGGTVSVFRFDADSHEHAVTTAGKFLADLDLSPGVTKGTLTVRGHEVPTVTVVGGAVYAGFVYRQTGCVVAAADRGALEKFLAAAPVIVSGGPLSTALKYPQYLDRFDRYGWGFYGFSGPSNHHGWNDKSSPGVDPLDDMEFVKKYNFRFELWPKPTLFDDNYSVGEWPEIRWLVVEAGKRDVPLAARLYGELPVVKEFSDLAEQPAPFLQGGRMRTEFMQKTWPWVSWFNAKGRLYMARQAQEQMRQLADVEIGSWMSPFGELVHDYWFNMHQDYSKAAVDNWHVYLRDTLTLTLAEVSAMFNRSDRPFASWDEVPVPEFANFTGLSGLVLDLTGRWHVRLAQENEAATEQWSKPDATVSGAEWDELLLPGAVEYHKYYRQDTWFVRDFSLSAAQLQKTPLWLYDFARGGTYGDPRVKSPVYLNGQRVGETGSWGAWDVTKLLQPGVNRLAIRSEYFSGRVFLSTEQPSVYPYLSPERNRLWVITQDWEKNAKRDTWAVGLAAMREVDPNAPFKFMAPIGFGTDRWIELATKFGGWPHFTGEGMWYFPWYKRYGFIYGLPGSSEMAGPARDAADMFRVMQRTFLAGLNSHDHVFIVQAATRLPEVKAWYERHAVILKQMGRYDIAGPQVLLYRSTNAATNLMFAPDPSLGDKTRPIQNPWNWDIGRGTLQSIGQSPLYIDDGGLRDGKLAGYDVLFDCGNEIMTAEAVRDIEQWVRDGGTYVTLPFTGRCQPDADRDTWHIQALTGCQVAKLRQPGQGNVTISGAAEQGLFKELAGKTFPDNGSSKDWQGFEYNILSTELTPGADSEVIARFENGAPAIVSHKLGKGRVITLGSVFFRQVQDIEGMWLPADLESVFYRDLLNGLGQPSVNFTDDYRILTQRYRTNNGLDDAVMLVSFADSDRTVALTVTLDQPPARIYRAAGDRLEEIKDFTVSGNVVKIPNLSVPKSEVQMFYFRAHAADDAARHWWAYQQRIWQFSPVQQVDFSPIAGKRWQEPTVNLKADAQWHWTQTAPADDDWRTNVKVSKDWPQWYLDIFTAVGADYQKPLFAFRTFSVPKEWLADGGVTRLVAADWQGGNNQLTAGQSPWRVWLNGQRLERPTFFNPEVGPLLRAGENTIAFAIDPPKQGYHLGVLGAVYLTHSAKPARVVSLAGEFVGKLDGQPVTLTFPGQGEAFSPTKTILIPREWENQYIVTYYARDPRNRSGQGSRQSSYGVVVNEREGRRRHHHTFGSEVEVDITELLKFGAENTLTPLSSYPPAEAKDWDLDEIELRLYPKADYRD